MKKFLILVLFVSLILIDAFTYAHTIQNEIADKVIRLHVLANDDSDYSQNLKLKVRDAILEFMKNKNFDNYNEAYASISNSLNDICEVATKTLALNNCYLNVSVTLDKSYFPQKTYNNLSFPAGVYTALKVNIGEAKGHNWWCVMYPTLCFSDNNCVSIDAEKNLKENLSDESFDIITQKSTFRFKIVDWFNKSL